MRASSGLLIPFLVSVSLTACRDWSVPNTDDDTGAENADAEALSEGDAAELDATDLAAAGATEAATISPGDADVSADAEADGGCPAGYTRSANSCVDIDECTASTHSCHVSARCENTDGGFDCSCAS